MKIIRIGLDLAKSVFQVHGVDEHGKAVVRRQLPRGKVLGYFLQLQPCVIGMEACSGSHYWARELSKQGHDVRLIAGQFVRPYRKSDKNDKNDAEAICEAVGRPNMRFVPIKSVDQQAVLTLHRVRQLRVTERTALVNQLRGLLGEYGVVISQGIANLRKALPGILEDAENGLPDLARVVFAELGTRIGELDRQIDDYDHKIQALAGRSLPERRLMKIAGIGALTASAIVATVGDATCFSNGRQLAAWLGLTPRQHSSGGKNRLGGISKRGDVYLRTLLIHGARSALQQTARRTDPKSRWAEALKERSGNNVAACALAAKNARIIWAVLARDQEYRRAA
jgi:transposase